MSLNYAIKVLKQEEEHIRSNMKISDRHCTESHVEWNRQMDKANGCLAGARLLEILLNKIESGGRWDEGR